MNFYGVNRLVHNEALVRQFVEAITGKEPTDPSQTQGLSRVPQSRAEIQAAMYKTPSADKQHQYRRGRGILKANDPLNQFKGEETSGDLNIVWITGMWSGAVPGTGRYSELLKPLGYNVKTVRTLADMKTAGLGRLVRHIPFQAVKNLHRRWAGAHIARNQEKVSNELSDSVPDLIIGSSQGGAIALSIADRYKDTPMLLLCPAWKIFNVTPTYVHPSTVIIHGVHDIEVPFKDSQELAQQFNLKLIPTEDGHIMKQGISVLVSQLHNLTPGLAKAKREREAEMERQRGTGAESQAQESVIQYKINLWLA